MAYSCQANAVLAEVSSNFFLSSLSVIKIKIVTL